ncbi:SRPBCC family protein [Microbispora sp. H11081]|uniref:SRPBCC family protein n=1 Tax=Microbispora sp. H11081 TaxID=2729107 RepID=UPI0014735706|nr:SRPBCC family protein [Microbispora sp. H11081]
MKLENTFVLPAAIDTAWQRLLDIEKVATCMPGASLENLSGDEFTGRVKVKLGPISMVYRGSARFVEKDPDGYRVVVSANGKEERGAGTANATVSALLVAEDANTTRVQVVTDLEITGRPAQFGRGVIADVGDRLLSQFADRLAATLAEPAAAEPPPMVQVAAAAPDSMNLIAVVGPPVLKRAVPVALGVLALILLVHAARRPRADEVPLVAWRPNRERFGRGSYHETPL